ncbi:hypothetical protein C0J52_24362 [Blattella germanica]|nr:hypothetical protein C0J52_24362 [Blattella germanica]
MAAEVHTSAHNARRHKRMGYVGHFINNAQWGAVEMDPAGVSGTVTVEDQRSYIKIETLRGKNPTEIHRALSEVCGELTVDRSTVSRWIHRFRVGRMSIDDDPRPGRP